MVVMVGFGAVGFVIVDVGEGGVVYFIRWFFVASLVVLVVYEVGEGGFVVLRVKD